jgi:ATP-dependent DNA ligase
MIKHGTAEKGHPLDAKIQPMLAITADEPFDSPEFAFEPKWDGVRTVAFVDGGIVRLQTRNLLDCTTQYPEAHGVSEALTGAYQAILDGEIVALDATRRACLRSSVSSRACTCAMSPSCGACASRRR